MKRKNSQKGNITTFALMMVAMMITILFMVVAIFMGNLNGILHGVKTDIYLLNRSAVVAVNKNQGSVDRFSYDEKEYYRYFKEALQKNYQLDSSLENPKGLIQKVTIEEYKIYRKNQKDAVSKQRTDGTIIHTVMTVHIRPIILRQTLEKYFVFRMHEDVYMEREKIS